MKVSGQLDALAALPPGKKFPETHWIGGWVGHSARLDVVVRRKYPCLAGYQTPVVQPVV
jgi:hypothetical protein